MNITTIKQNLQNLKPQHWLLIGLSCILVIILMITFFSSIGNWWHDTRYENIHGKDANTVINAETNANQHLINANQAENKQKELEQNETNINKRKTETETLSNDARQHSDNTRDALNTALNKAVPDRNGDDGSDDDSLRTDANRNKTAINTRRTAPDATQQPRP